MNSNVLFNQFIRILPYMKYIIPLFDLIIVVIVALAIRNRGHKIEKNYLKSSATITSVDWDYDSSFIRYEFRDNYGLTHSKTTPAYGKYQNLREGSQITVYYDPAAPDSSYPIFKVNKYKLAPVTAVVIILFILLMFYLSQH